MQPDAQPPQPAIPVVLDYGQADSLQERPLIAITERVVHFITAIVLPIACFAISSTHYPPGPEWQRNHWADYLGIIPTTQAGWPFYPLLAFSMYAAGYMIFRPRWAIHSLSVRIGLITGVVLAYQFAFIQVVTVRGYSSIATDIPLGVFLPVAMVTLVVIFHRLAEALVWQRRWYRGRGRKYFWIGLAVLIGAAMVSRDIRRGSLGVTIFSSLLLAPGLTMTTFTLMLIVCLTHGRLSQRNPLAIVAWSATWLTAFSVAWIKSYQAAVEAYALLPKDNPSCYIATAAAQGHESIVGSWSTGDGYRINRQLAIFKSGEKALARRSPQTHRRLRQIYDSIGPAMANQLRRRWIADFAYLTLKPLEWLTAVTLSVSTMPSVER